MVSTDTPFGHLRHLGPVVEMSETPTYWTHPTVPANPRRAHVGLGGREAFEPPPRGRSLDHLRLPLQTERTPYRLADGRSPVVFQSTGDTAWHIDPIFRFWPNSM
jgi:hypothetical protein